MIQTRNGQNDIDLDDNKNNKNLKSNKKNIIIVVYAQEKNS